MNKLPTKEQIKEKFSIPDDDFEIKTKLPTEEEIKKNPGFLEKLGSISGFKAWKRKSKIGKLIDIILIPPAISAALSFYSPFAHYTYDVGKRIYQNIQWPKEDQETKTIVILPPKIELQDAKDLQELDEYPTGTELIVVSGTMPLD